MTFLTATSDHANLTVLEGESLAASLELAIFQMDRGVTWSAGEIIRETIRALRGQPLQVQ